MRKLLSILLLLLCCTVTSWSTSIGTWKHFPAFRDITGIQPAGDNIYVLSSKALFAYHYNDESIQTFDKTNVLNDCNIAFIAYCKAAHRLVIIYDNYNIDLLDDNGEVVSISDYYRKSMMADKTINKVNIIGEYAFICTGFGILQLNVSKAEITNTYNINKNIVSVCIFNNSIYACTKTEGVWYGSMNDNLLDRNNWKQFSNYLIQNIYVIDNKMIGAAYKDVYCWNNSDGSWNKLLDAEYSFCQLTDDKMILGKDNTFYVISNDNDVQTIRYNNTFNIAAYDNTHHCFWSNDNDNYLTAYTYNDNTLQPILSRINADGPQFNHFDFMRFKNNRLYTVGGSFTPGEPDPVNPGIVQIYNNNQWTIYPTTLKQETGVDYIDACAIAVDPADADHVYVGARSGLYEFKNGEYVNYYNETNSPLLSANGHLSSTLVFGVEFDNENNLWCFNSQTSNVSVFSLSKSKEWKSYHKDIFMSEGISLANMRHPMIDSRGLLWFVNDHYFLPAFYCMDTKTGAVNYYTRFVNEDGTQVYTNWVHCIAEDKEKNIWVGTEGGPIMLRHEDLSLGSDAVLYQIKVPRNDGTNYADYLLNGVEVLSMAIDGAGRKWFGTKNNGVYLISADNMTQIQHFMSDNSPLLSNVIYSIAINPQTGEVFFGTENGLCSYMSDATEENAEMNEDNVYAYPNPVTPEYKGLITIVGLTYNSDVKITTSNGALIAQGKSNGGTFTWDGCDLDGHRVASGVYMVHTATSDGSKGVVCKVAIVN